jgi:hypothetical protein
MNELDDQIAHCKLVWKNYVKEAGFESIYVIADSNGGRCLSEI